MKFHRRVPFLISLFLLVAIVLPLGFTAPASAHSGDQSYLYIDLTPTASGRLEMPFIDVQEHLGLELEGSDEAIDSEIDRSADLLAEYALGHVRVGQGGVDWDLETVRVERLYEIDYIGVTFNIGAEVEQFSEPFFVELDPFFDENPDRDALLVIGNAWDLGYVDNQEDALLRFTPDSTTQDVDLGESSRWRNFTGSIGLGVDHIRTGPDHILFVAVLLLPSVLVFTAGWHTATSFRSSLWRLLKIVSMFTLAHSLTFTLVGVGLVPDPPGRLVESIIALSIGIAAIHNLRPILPDREMWLALVFGLFHGLGFASLVADLDVSTGSKLISLLGRNVGIEIGQAVVVLMLFPIMYGLTRTKIYRPLFIVANIVLTVVALGWFIERTVGGPALTTKALDQVLMWPRVLWLWGALLVGSIGFIASRRRAGELVEPGSPLHASIITLDDDADRTVSA